MWVELTHNFTHDTRRLLRRLRRRVPYPFHPVQHTAVHRLKAVAHIRERTGNDNRHRVVNVSTLHFLLNINLLNTIFCHIFYLLLSFCDHINMVTALSCKDNANRLYNKHPHIETQNFFVPVNHTPSTKQSKFSSIGTIFVSLNQKSTHI